MSTSPEAGDGRQELIGEIRAVLHEELGRILEERARVGAPPVPGEEDPWGGFRERVRGLIDRELPRDRRDLVPLREEFEQVLSRLRAPAPVENERLREELEAAGGALGEGEEEARVRERWRKELERLLPSTGRIRKVIVAVHGIGDQANFGTIQQTAHAFCRYMGVPASFPLGRFHGRLSSVVRALVPTSPPDPAWRPGAEGTPQDPVPWPLAFAEIYWANVPREVIKEGYTLEEAKRWARTLVERLRYKASRKVGGTSADHVSQRAYEHFGRVIDDIITSVTVAERLLRVVRYAGLGDIQLKKILDDYLNDVQAVAEFYNLRRRLLDIFTDVMRQVSRSCPDAEIYVVAHSEGTVVSFLGLIEGIANGESWVKDVKGLMTIGSPLNKHVLLWREIFDEYKAPAVASGHKIAWHNYYEHGDPIGYNLKITYDWMADKSGQHWERFFDYDPEASDHGYAHSPLPGEAHNHYWRDDKVFGHFISNVVDPEGELIPGGRYRKHPAPGGELDKKIWSYVLPYVLSTAILFVGTYILYRASRVVIDPDGARGEGLVGVFRNTFALTALVAGTTALATLPRLLTPIVGMLAALFPFALGAGLFVGLFETNHRDTIAEGWEKLTGGVVGGSWGLPLDGGALIVIALAFLSGALAGVLRWLAPARGLKPMVALGAIAVLLAVVPAIVAGMGATSTTPVWPVVLALLAFLYLWWLATLLFDVSVIWHYYIRWERSQKYLAEIAASQPASDEAGA